MRFGGLRMAGWCWLGDSKMKETMVAAREEMLGGVMVVVLDAFGGVTRGGDSMVVIVAG